MPPSVFRCLEAVRQKNLRARRKIPSPRANRLRRFCEPTNVLSEIVLLSQVPIRNRTARF